MVVKRGITLANKIKEQKLILANFLLTEFGKNKVDGVTENELEILNLLVKDIDFQEPLESNNGN